MTKLYNETKAKVYDRLKSITGVTVVDGWLTLYVDDFLNPNVPEYTFPGLFIEYVEDENSTQNSTVDNKCKRTLSVVGAIATDVPEDVNKDLDTLLLQVKAALKKDASIDNRSADVTKVTFEVAETRDYAIFKATLVVTCTEKWELN